ncbi:MAG: SMC family ATPase [Thermoleophilaceae bacterium]|nr:SMC family ATPase [Thermoleophilaceae bacterium]
MKLVSLRLENFRAFEHCELELHSDGLIGVSGPNGAGKSTLLDAINYALFGLGRGSRKRRPERDGMPAGAKCEVKLEFILDDHSCVVVRGPKKARLTVDGEDWLRDGQEELTRRVTELLGVGQLNFGMTFYARQRELQALQEGGKRKLEQLETLLGIDRIRNARTLAHDAETTQEKVVRALATQVPSVADAEAKLRRAEEEAQRLAPSVESAREARDEAAALREKARTALTEARERAEEALALEGKAAVAASELAAATERESMTRESMMAAKAAATELQALEPAAAKAGELRAQDRALELEGQAAAQAAGLREQRHEAQLAAVAVGDALAATADPAPRLAGADGELTEARSELERVTSEMLELSSLQETLRAAAADAAAAVTNGRRALAVHEELARLAGLREAVENRALEIAALEAEAAQLVAHVTEESEHYEHVKRDGRNATCPRCKAPYGDRYETIVEEFEESLAGFSKRQREIADELERLRKARKGDAAKLERLASAEAERKALGEVTTDIAALDAAAAGAEEARGQHVKDSERLTKRRGDLTETIAALDRELSGLRQELATREQLAAHQREAERGLELFEKQLTELSPNGYDADAHEAVRRALARATSAETHCAELRPQVAQIELLETRLAREEQLSAAARTAHEDLAPAAAKRAADKAAPEEAETAYDVTVLAHAQADEALHDAEQQAIAESNAVAQARAELEAAQRLKGQLDTEREELSMRRVVKTVLDNYRTAVQQEAVPSLEQETAEFLRRTTRGRYSDVQISADGELQINDMGTPYELERFSGGEQDLANLCMRIALSKVLARRSGMDARFIILDEVFGSQDADRRRALLEALRELDQEFGQVLIVSHFDDFMEHCGLQITVKSDNGRSVAELATA